MRHYKDNPWNISTSYLDHLVVDAVEILEAIANIQMLNKLSDVRHAWGKLKTCDGVELCNRLQPKTSGDAQRWLNEQDRAISILKDLQLIYHSERNGGPYGYGCDQIYEVTDLGREMMKAYPDKYVLQDRVATLLSYR